MLYNINMDAVELCGPVSRYRGNGRKLGYPTANITADTDLEDGVYFGFADLGEYSNHPAVIFIGVPTTMGDRDRRVEAYLLDIPDKDHYDEELRLVVQHYHRPNETFNSVNDLKEIMGEDEATARLWFSL
jgi:riboflavin kinase / FMN adenylyltransferase